MTWFSELRFGSRRSPVFGTHGIVASSQPLASQAGLSILMQGGNAADAAVATAAALNVTEPCSTGIGGDCFSLFYEAASGTVTALNASGRAPMGLSIDLIRRDGSAPSGALPPRHAHTVTVPGACSGWFEMIGRHGSMPMTAILGPAIRLAEEGYPVSPIAAYLWAHSAENELRLDKGHELTIDGRAPRAGEIFRNPGLARTFRAIAEGGPDAFYQGNIGRQIVETVQNAGGVMTVEDLATHMATWDTPISIMYHGVRVWECPPNGQGLAALLALNVLNELPIHAPLSADRVHLQVEAMRLAFADAATYIADPRAVAVPISGLLSEAYAAERRALIEPTRAMPRPSHGLPTAGSDTVYFCVVDGAGNACSFINSNYNGFGTGLVPRGCGFSLHNRGRNFSLIAGHLNALAPGKRPYHTIIPGMATRADGSLLCPFGVMGGFMQPQGHMQVIVGLVDDDLDPQSALDQPRFCVEDDVVYVEEGMPSTELASRGHHVEVVRGYDRAGYLGVAIGGVRPMKTLFGRGQIIIRQPDGVLCAGSDMRGDGCAMGW